MKTQQECWEALCAGHTLQSEDELVRFDSGRQVYTNKYSPAGIWNTATFSFRQPEKWSIYEPPKEKVVRWLWATADGKKISKRMFEEMDSKYDYFTLFTVKLEWSRQEFEK